MNNKTNKGDANPVNQNSEMGTNSPADEYQTVKETNKGTEGHIYINWYNIYFPRQAYCDISRIYIIVSIWFGKFYPGYFEIIFWKFFYADIREE